MTFGTDPRALLAPRKSDLGRTAVSCRPYKIESLRAFRLIVKTRLFEMNLAAEYPAQVPREPETDSFANRSNEKPKLACGQVCD